ncbi:MAG: acyloxyacyl hydrolase, partial [Hyphomonadaceae bacterium]
FAGDEIGWGLTPFALASWSGAERTNFIAAGVEHAFDFGGWTVRPALGAAVHDGCITGCAAQVNLGSRALFYLRLDVVHAVSTHWSLGLRLEHLSNAGLGAVNPGMEEAGLVLSRKF